MKLKLIKFQVSKTDDTQTCFDCGFVSYIYLYELTVEVVAADKHKVGSQRLIRFKENPYIDTHIVNKEEFWKEFFDENDVPECDSFDDWIWVNCLQKQYQGTIGVKKDKEITERVLSLLNEGEQNESK